jgi:hypothetical protein
MQLVVTRLGKQSLILGYNWLQNRNPEINWLTKDVKMSHSPIQCSTCRVEDKHEVKSTTSQINACRSGAFPTMVKEDEDESPHVNADETDEEAQDTCPAFDDDLDSEVDDFTIEEDDRVFMAMVHPCKGTSVHFLTSPILSHSSPVHMYSLSLPLYYLQGPMVRRLSRS